MNIGILYEGRYDKSPIISIVELVLKEIQCDLKVTFITSEAGGSILPKMASSAIIFFEGIKHCDLALYISDTDYDSRKKRKINSWVNNYCRLNPLAKIITAHPEPYLEQWFLNNPESIIKTFSLGSNVILPFSEEIDPKKRFTTLIEFFNHDKSKSKADLYSEVASNLNLEALASKDISCKLFYKQVKQVLRNLCRSHSH